MYRFLIFSILVFGLALSGPIAADSIPFQDDTVHFPGWPFLTGTDAHGIPDFGNGLNNGVTAAEVQIDKVGDDYFLKGIEFFYGYGQQWNNPSYVSRWDQLYPGDLFLSVNAPGFWNYVVKLPDSRIPGANPLNPYPVNAGTYDLYYLGNARPIGQDPNPAPDPLVNYLIATASNYRTGHPYAVDRADLDPDWIVEDISVTFTGFDKPLHGAGTQGYLVSSLFTFEGGGLKLPEGEFTFGWTQMCANDVIMGTTAIPGSEPEIPEPGTLLLLGTGLVGLVARRRRQS